MSIGNYLKIIGRGRESARALTRADAGDMFGQILDGTVTDLEVGAFCLAMRIKGETPDEMAGFLDATHQRMEPIPAAAGAGAMPRVVLPSYNGARRLPVLTPLLALLLAREGFAVVIHGTATESKRTYTSEVLELLDIPSCRPDQAGRSAGVCFVPTVQLHAGLQRLLDARRVIQLRNPAHSLVKLLRPCQGPQLLVTSYTHPEYASTMAEVLQLTGSTALLLRGTEGEAVADPRRVPTMRSIANGVPYADYPAQAGVVADLPELPVTCEASGTARYIQSVLAGDTPLPAPIALQVQRIAELARQVR